MRNKYTNGSTVYIIHAIIIILILNVPLMLLLNSFRFTAFDFNWYEKEFTKVGSYEFGYTKETIGSTAKYLIDYLKYDDSNNPSKIEIYGSDENIHLLEVKTIMQKALLVADFTIFIFIIGNLMLFLLSYEIRYGIKNGYFDYHRYVNYASKSLIYGGLLTIALIGFILLALKFNFYSTFTIFHKILSFEQWQFPVSSNMIRMFPEEFFYDIGVRIFLLAITSAILLVGTGLIAHRRFNSNKINC